MLPAKKIHTVDDFRDDLQFQDILHRLALTLVDLTPTELTICALIKQNYKCFAISSFLGIEEHTVENHCYSIRKKLGLRNKSQSLRRYLMALF